MKNMDMKLVGNYFESVSQAFFFKNAWFGIGLLLLLSAFSRELFLCGVIGSLIGYTYSHTYSTPTVLKDCGLIPINGFFFGIAMASLFQGTPQFYTLLILGAVCIPLITKAAYEVLQHWKLSPLIIPYILVIWVITLCGSGLKLAPLTPVYWTANVPFLPALDLYFDPQFTILWATLQSMGRLLFLPNPVFGLAVLSLVTAFSPRRGFYFLFGTLMATAAAYYLSAQSATFGYAFYSYSAGLIGLGLASFPEKFRMRTIFIFCVISTFLTMAVDRVLGAQLLPTLSLPYVLTLWLAILSRVPRLSLSWAPAQTTSNRVLLAPTLSLDRLEPAPAKNESAA